MLSFDLVQLITASVALLAMVWILYSRASHSKRDTAVVSQLWVYPIKSCRGVQMRHAEIDRRGFKYDRNFMVVSGPKVWALMT